MNKLKYILSIFLTTFILLGCSSGPKNNEQFKSVNREINKDCYDAANYAKTMAVLREANIPSTSIEEYTTVSTVTVFPVKTIQQYVLVSKSSPIEAYSTILTLCDNFGWHRLETELKTIYPDIPKNIIEKDINIYPKTPKNVNVDSSNTYDPTCLSGVWTPSFIMNKEGTKVVWINLYDDKNLNDLYLNPNIERSIDNKIFYVCSK